MSGRGRGGGGRTIVHYVMCNSLFKQRKDNIFNISWVVLVCHNGVTNMCPNIGWIWRLMIMIISVHI